MKMDKYINQLNIENIYPFHMPGHKRSGLAVGDMVNNPYKIDITEIDGYDNLHHPEGIIAEIENRISKLYSSSASYMLVNGSTSGILAAISATTNYGDDVVISRNSHKAAYNAVCIRGLDADYVYPSTIEELDINAGISAEKVKELFEKNQEKNYRFVYITSPTYEGVVSDIESIAKVVHEANAVLIVDEAHGAHFGLSEYFPKSAVSLGADIVIQSIHKTLSGMTQTAVLHVSAEGKDRIDMEKLRYYLSVYQTSSPSYVLMSSVDNCYSYIEENKTIWYEYHKKLQSFFEKSKLLKDITLFSLEKLSYVDKKKIFDYDCGKILIYSKGAVFSGKEIYNYLRLEYGLQLEMSLGRYALAMTSYMDDENAFERLYNALNKLDELAIDMKKNVCQDTKIIKKQYIIGQTENEKRCTISEAFEAVKEITELRQGVISGDFCYAYPPGIPFLVPGEVVTKGLIEEIKTFRESGYEIKGIIEQESELYIKNVVK